MGATPIDLELHVTTVKSEGEWALRYMLNSSSGAAEYYWQEAGVQRIGSDKSFRASLAELYGQLKRLNRGLDVDKDGLSRSEVEDDLATIGRDLYQRLFPSELRAAYREFRNKVNTVLIISDDRWAIPWELIRPFDEGIDDDFMCVKFQLTRWLAGGLQPPDQVWATRVACVMTGAKTGQVELPSSLEEYQLLSELWAEIPGVEDVSLPEASFRQLKDLLEQGGLGLVHFVGHGDYNVEQPGESKIELVDRAFRARNLIGPVQLRFRADRPLVFLNACRVARQGWELTGLAGWAEGWVRGCGCGAFIGPQWMVNDRSALEFAEVFYRELGKGRTFGEATQQARTEMREQAPGRLTWVAYSVYAQPNGRLVLGEEMPEAKVPRAGVPAEIRGGILDFGRFMADKTEDFVGRQWLFDRIGEFLDQQPRGYLLLCGDPGIGKSAFAAEIARREGCVHHFNIRAEGLNRPKNFLANVCAQLIAAYGLPHTFLPPEATRDGNFLKGLLEQVVSHHPEKKIMIVVDALDEAIPVGEGVNPLFLPLTVPRGVYIITTALGGTRLTTDCEFDKQVIDQDDERNLADVRIFVESKVGCSGIHSFIEARRLEEEAFVAEMIQKSQGNFMYLRHVLQEIERGTYQRRSLHTLPGGLENYYEDLWHRMQSRDEDAWFSYQLPVLLALAVVKEPVSIDFIAKFSGVDRRRIRRILAKWAPFLCSTEVEEQDGSLQMRYRLYHASFQQFVEKRLDDEARDNKQRQKRGFDAESLRVFLCHATEDKSKVRKLYQSLRSECVHAWLDEEEILPGQDWRREIERAIRFSHVVLVCLSKTSRTKEGFVHKEIAEALNLADEKPGGTIYIIPLRLEECQVPGRLFRWQYVDLFTEGGFGKLMKALRRRAADLNIKL